MVYEGGLASRSDNPFGSTVLNVMFSYVIADTLPVPAKAMAKIRRHSAA
jgi:hypothetical protein